MPKCSVSRSNLKEAFNFFDKDDCGHITLDDFKKAIGGSNINEEKWRAIINGVDKDGDGKIDFLEFNDMMS